MPQRKKVPRIDELSLRVLMSSMKLTLKNLIHWNEASLQSALEEVNVVNRDLWCSVTPAIQEEIFTEFLKTIEDSLHKYQDLEGVVAKLMLFLIPSTLHALRLRLRKWNRANKLILLESLKTLTSLKVLDLREECSDSECEEMIDQATSRMPNLTILQKGNKKYRFSEKKSSTVPLEDRDPRLVEISIHSITASMEVMIINVIHQIEAKLRSALDEVNQYLHHSKRSLRSDLPERSDLQEEIFREFSKVAEHLLPQYEAYKDKPAMVLRVMMSLLPPTLHALRLNLEAVDENSKPALLKGLCKLTSLKVLYLETIYDVVESGQEEIIQAIIEAIHMLPNLTSFHMVNRITDGIIQALGKSCPNLTALGGGHYDDADEYDNIELSSLLALRRLRKLKLRKLSYSQTQYVELILGLEDLEEIEQESLDLVEVMKEIEEDGYFEHTFKLKSCGAKIGSAEDLMILSNMCPCLTALSLNLWIETESDSDCNPEPLSDLQKLKINCEKYPAVPMEPMLKMLGCGITTLSLVNVTDMDFDAIVRFCPSLKFLELRECHLTSPMTSSPSKFWDLESLLIEGYFKMTCIEPLLLCVVNIKVLELSMENYFARLADTYIVDEGTMLMIFDRNPMAQLQKFILRHSNNLSMKTVRTMMRNCDNLKEIYRLNEWRCISPSELSNFRDELKRNNIDLDVDYSYDH